MTKRKAQDKITYILCHTKSKKMLKIQWHYKHIQENSRFFFFGFFFGIFFFGKMSKCGTMVELCKQHKVSKKKKT